MSALTSIADASRQMPECPTARLDHARAALGTLHAEQRRLERLGLELPLARCGAQIRYWRFVEAILTLPPLDGEPPAGGSR